MRRITSILCTVLVALGAIILSPTTRAQDVSPEIFYGRFVGSGFTFGDTAYYELTKNDLTVEIGPEGDGFFVAWTTVLRPLATDKPRRSASRMSFVPTGRPGTYLERSAELRLQEGLAWATINGPLLSVSVLTVRNDGSYVVQTYHRIIFSEGMMLQFRADQNGDTMRLISGRLTKQK